MTFKDRFWPTGTAWGRAGGRLSPMDHWGYPCKGGKEHVGFVAWKEKGRKKCIWEGKRKKKKKRKNPLGK